VIERAVLLSRSSFIDVEVLPDRIISSNQSRTDSEFEEHEEPTVAWLKIPLGMKFEKIEKKVLLATLKMVDNNKTKAAKILGISLKTIHNKLGKYHDEN
jgi:two-component system response regulator HydG